MQGSWRGDGQLTRSLGSGWRELGFLPTFVTGERLAEAVQDKQQSALPCRTYGCLPAGERGWGDGSLERWHLVL